MAEPSDEQEGMTAVFNTDNGMVTFSDGTQGDVSIMIDENGYATDDPGDAVLVIVPVETGFLQVDVTSDEFRSSLH